MSKNKINLIMRYLLILPLLLVFVTGICATEAKASGPLGMVKIEDCEVSESGLDCEEKMVITFPVTYGMETNLEALAVKQISKDGEPQTVEETFTISITKSKPIESYPLRYLHTVSYFPYEQVIQVPHPSSGCESCIDCEDAEEPTSGWTYQGSYKIPHSQGFCIAKTINELAKSCLFRGEELILGGPATMENPYSTAHSMRLGELFFDGYEISEYIKSYEIEVEVIKGEETHVFTISPDDPLYSCRDDEEYNGELKMKAELIGEMPEYTGTPELDNYILYIPSSPSDHPFVQDYQNNMLLVPREELSRDGGEPDKVGVSFYTFRLLGSDYSVSQAGDGLHNQLFHKHNDDLQKLITNPNAETSWLVHGKKDFKGSMEFEAGMAKVLEHRINHINNSLVQITVDLETVKVIKTESVGAIIEAYVEKFTSMTEDGTLVVKIGNFGDLRSDYIVTVTDATSNIIGYKGDGAVPAQARTVEPYEEAELKFDVSTRFNLETTNEVLVTLKSTTGRIYDKTTVVFDTEAFHTEEHPTKYSWELQQKNEASEITTAGTECSLDIKENVKSRLSLYVDESKRVGRAVDMIDKSLDSKYWLDETHLDCKHGKKVFDYERYAIKELMYLLKGLDDNKCGGVASMTLEYSGGAGASITVDKGTVTDNGDGIYTITPEDGTDKLSSNTKIYVDGVLNTEIHTSCSKPIDISDIHGDFVIDDLYKLLKDSKKHQVSDEAIACAQAGIEKLVRVDRILAETNIIEAEGTLVVDPNNQDKVDEELAKAHEELDKGDADRDAGKYDKAIQHYSQAWEHACHALKEATKT